VLKKAFKPDARVRSSRWGLAGIIAARRGGVEFHGCGGTQPARQIRSGLLPTAIAELSSVSMTIMHGIEYGIAGVSAARAMRVIAS
jgi:hypothetical protein